MIRRLLIALAILAVTLAVVVREIDERWSQALNIDTEGYHLTVASGQGLRSVAQGLQLEGVVSQPYLLLAYGRWTGLDAQIKRGEYLIPQGATAVDLLEILGSGAVIQYQITLPEGITLVQAIALLGNQKQLTRVLEGSEDKRIRELVLPRQSAEGLFFPDSYRYEKGATDWQILQRAHGRMQEVLAREWRDRLPSLPYENPYEALIMASIVERETGVANERSEIAGVFVRRLMKKMRLQTDPTVIYGLGENFDGNLRRRHLQDESNPYNTYRHRGLPPSPIALPGMAAINAALHPDSGTALYFVAKGDGSHQFSASLQEHQNAVRKYQLNRSTTYRSSPGKN